MKRFVLMLLCLAAINYTNGQLVVEFSKQKKRSKIIAMVQLKGNSSARDSTLRTEVERNLNASMTIGKGVKKGKYIVAVKYIISRDGSVSDISCENDPGYGMCQEVIRVLKKTKNWTPAIQNGRNVSTYRH